MRMVNFGGLFPEVAARHMVMLWIDPPGKALPVKTYGLLEFYCDQPDCDCRRVVLDAISCDHQERIFASIHFGWESLAFYRKWAESRRIAQREARPLKKGVLNPADFNCDWADLILRHVRKKVLADPKAVARFKKHYAMAKREQRKQLRAGENRP